ncbi:hypothetical protein DNTS_035601 [Danionella cerebrum]|uniref:Uncharacterized protein n=1 Tax=Danionella cerebrum TaxID=2873325 RepID=A0A553MUC3_9TELE|nr:hypothetical protein DNTS_035601 [Danionella translucida]
MSHREKCIHKYRGTSEAVCVEFQKSIAEIRRSRQSIKDSGWEDGSVRFVKIQDIDTTRVHKPNFIETFRVDGEWYFAVVDSSKAGSTSLYRWNSNGFYSQQSLHPWHRDTHIDFLELEGKPCLLLSSASEPPVVYQWNRSQQQFLYLFQITDSGNIQMVKHFCIRKVLYICLTRFIGDSKILRWDSQRLVEIQTLPSRGSMAAYPFSIGIRQYLVLGSDYSFSRIYLWDELTQRFQPFQELNMLAPRGFTVVSVDEKDILIAAIVQWPGFLLPDVLASALP